jgi:hypothetical protein
LKVAMAGSVLLGAALVLGAAMKLTPTMAVAADKAETILRLTVSPLLLDGGTDLVLRKNQFRLPIVSIRATSVAGHQRGSSAARSNGYWIPDT